MVSNNQSFVNGVATTAVLDEQNVYSSIINFYFIETIEFQLHLQNDFV